MVALLFTMWAIAVIIISVLHWFARRAQVRSEDALADRVPPPDYF